MLIVCRTKMLLPLLVTQFILAVTANSFHKYPYVFLLDVGNEEIEKLNTEQLRLSIPGGSLAFKYPAAGEGDMIGHVRVSGIDFGTDLKASIIQGGPGYKYVVLLFIGNPGVAYDAVVTIQTVADINEETVITNHKSEIDDDLNNSVEESDDENQNVHSENENIQSMQSSSNIYKYSNEEFDSQSKEDVGENDENNNLNSQQERINQIENDDEDVDLKDNSIDSTGDNRVDVNQYGKYESFKPLIIGGVRFYPQAAIYTQDYNNDKSIYDQEKHASDDGVSENKYKDKNYNDPDYETPVEYKK